MDLLHLGSFILMLYSSIIAFYIVFRIYNIRKNTAYLALIFGLMLLTHSFYHLGGALQNILAITVFGFSSAALAFIFSLAYSILRK